MRANAKAQGLLIWVFQMRRYRDTKKWCFEPTLWRYVKEFNVYGCYLGVITDMILADLYACKL